MSYPSALEKIVQHGRNSEAAEYIGDLNFFINGSTTETYRVQKLGNAIFPHE